MAKQKTHKDGKISIIPSDRNNRLRQFVLFKWGTLHEASRKIPMRYENLVAYVNGGRQPGPVMYNRLIPFGLNVNWVETGLGNMILEDYIIKEPDVTYAAIHEHIPDINMMMDLEITDMPAHANVGSLVYFNDLPVSFRKLSLGYKNPQNLKGIRVHGNSMSEARIYDGDIVIYDTQSDPFTGCEVLAMLNGTLLIKRFEKKGHEIYLHSAYNGTPPIIVNEIDDTLTIIGVVKGKFEDR